LGVGRRKGTVKFEEQKLSPNFKGHYKEAKRGRGTCCPGQIVMTPGMKRHGASRRYFCGEGYIDYPLQKRRSIPWVLGRCPPISAPHQYPAQRRIPGARSVAAYAIHKFFFNDNESFVLCPYTDHYRIVRLRRAPGKCSEGTHPGRKKSHHNRGMVRLISPETFGGRPVLAISGQLGIYGVGFFGRRASPFTNFER